MRSSVGSPEPVAHEYNPESTSAPSKGLEVRDLTLTFQLGDQQVPALNSVSLRVGPGETVVVLGESGSGKSMLGLTIMGLQPVPPTIRVEGEIRVDGVDVLPLTMRQKRRYRGTAVAMIFQDALSALNPVLTVGYQVAEAVRAHGGVSRKAARARAIELLSHVEIPSPERRYSAYPHEFSGGMRQRVMIAMAIASNPAVLIADEPTTALDVTVQAQIIDLLTRLQDEKGMGIMLVTHDIGVAAQIADRIAVMYGGRVIEEGPTKELLQSPRHPYTMGLLASVPSIRARRSELEPIPGTPPMLTALPSGCAFRTRCSFATEACANVVPPLESAGKNRRVACIRWLEIGERP